MDALGVLLVLLAAGVLVAVGLRLTSDWWVALASRTIERGFGGYRHVWVAAEPDKPCRLEEGVERHVGIVGGGLAGLVAATTLAERGYRVHLWEKNAYLGGKLGSWQVQLGEEREWVSHGFHAFFRHYYNLTAWLDELELSPAFRPIQDYLILHKDGSRTSFSSVTTVPVLNLVGLWWVGTYRMRDIVLTPARYVMHLFVRYDAERFAAYDELTFAEFAERWHIPASLMVTFNTFARVFFATPDRMSMAEVFKSFHFYYLSHDHGLAYDYPEDDYERTLLAPIRAFLERHGVQVHTHTDVGEVRRTEDGFEVCGQPVEQLILAPSPVGALQVLRQSPTLAPELTERLARIQPTQRYAVLRLWLDRDSPTDLPDYLITDRIVLLDAIAFYDHVEAGSRDWAERHGGGVIELHSYSVPDGVVGEEAVREQLLAELWQFLPQLDGTGIRHEHLQVRQDFAAFHTHMQAHRPSVRTGVDGLYLAGDWVAMDAPAMLMEAAASSGRLAANAVLAEDGLAPVPLWTVPRTGLAPAPR